ncbi:hypothetical protein GO013_16060 [Pseudodesulfovibrio sp. JC047]|uniref:Mu-like prophage major head subunit gpT family protein n=1 Tax=Pseudodesulfovibrio sp. JC047 TaxID=2683199 RepID=UPI0013D579A1|nr:Mu-like prophage major head subunit gpT family protein [Pseudodesulfovibrio sp. JC047]NDV20926.1 hypothetical protein [Pseudodesulfovibrio sp. JC047]
MIINHGTLNALFTGFKTIFNKAFEGTPSDWKKLAMIVPSSTSQEVYAWLGATTGFREWLGDRVIQALKSHKFTIVNRTFENTVGVPREAIEDDQLGVYNPMVANLGYDTQTFPDLLIFGLLKDGFTGLCYDGQPFFDADHPVYDPKTKKEVSVSNVQAGSEAPWFLLDVSRPVKPIIFQQRRKFDFVSMTDKKDRNVFMQKEYVYGVDGRCEAGYGLWQMAHGSKAPLNTTNYKAARAALMSMKGDNGNPLGIRPTLLVCGPGNEGSALEVLKAERDANGATNVYRNTADLLVTPWLA